MPAQIFFCEFCKVSHDTFFKEPFRGLLLHKHSFYHHDLLPFQKRCHTYPPPEYFIGLICRLGTRVSTIFQTLRQKPIFKPDDHLRWSFSEKIVNSIKPLSIFLKKLHCRCSAKFWIRLCKKPLKGVVKWKTKTW